MDITILGLCFTDQASGLPFGHDPFLVLLSYVTAAFASYVSLDMAERLRHASAAHDANPWSSHAWHAGASLSLGGGIWAMHFIAMLALHISVPVTYDLGLTILSLLVPVLMVGVGIWMVRSGLQPWRLLAAGVIVGLGVVVMHYSGMAALILPGSVAYHVNLFAISVMIAIAAAITALWLAFNVRGPIFRIVAALVMGVAICGMHFTGMAGTEIRVDSLALDPQSGASRVLLAVAVGATTYGVLLLALITSIADRRLTAAAAREAQSIRRSYAELQAEMAVRRQVETDLERTRDSLEERVAERTRDLEEARQRAEAASTAKSEFLASMSHELRTPLNSILGFSQLLTFNREKEPLTPRQERGVQQIERAGKHLLRLIDEVLDLAKVEAGRLTLSLEPVAVADLAADAVTPLQPVAAAAGITIDLVAPPDLPAAKADRTRLHQVLTNLLSNAIKYNRPGGRAVLTVENVPEIDKLRLTVSDTGLGIPADKLPELFQPFNRLGREHGAIEGTGIGLTICRQLVEAMGGTITVESIEGAGSRFIVSLPSAPAPALTATAAELAAPSFDGTERTLLYVEDNRANIQLMRDLIDSVGGYRLLVAETAEAGLATARQHRPDLMVLDINLPGTDGIELLRQLRHCGDTADIPAIALSANAMPAEIRRGLAAGFHCWLTKPLQVDLFLRTIAELSQSKAAPDA